MLYTVQYMKPKNQYHGRRIKNSLLQKQLQLKSTLGPFYLLNSIVNILNKVSTGWLSYG